MASTERESWIVGWLDGWMDGFTFRTRDDGLTEGKEEFLDRRRVEEKGIYILRVRGKRETHTDCLNIYTSMPFPSLLLLYY
jgi:hypothetical protein